MDGRMCAFHSRQVEHSSGHRQLQQHSHPACPLCHQPTPTPDNEGDGPEIVVKLRPAKFGAKPANVMCPFCKELVTTEINFVDGAYVWFMFGCLFMFGFILIAPWFSCCIPFIIDKYKDVNHYCPNCHGLIYAYKRWNTS